MPSTDLDRGGAKRLGQNLYLGPSLGWKYVNTTDVLEISTAGTFDVPFATTIVKVGINALVTVQLPSSIPPLGLVAPTITIVDIGGFAGGFPITILPTGGQLIEGGASASISQAFGSKTLIPLLAGGWVEQAEA